MPSPMDMILQQAQAAAQAALKPKPATYSTQGSNAIQPPPPLPAPTNAAQSAASNFFNSTNAPNSSATFNQLLKQQPAINIATGQNVPAALKTIASTPVGNTGDAILGEQMAVNKLKEQHQTVTETLNGGVSKDDAPQGPPITSNPLLHPDVKKPAPASQTKIDTSTLPIPPITGGGPPPSTGTSGTQGSATPPPVTGDIPSLQQKLYQTLSTQTNPYATNTDAYKTYVQGLQNQAQSQFGSQQQALNAQLAGRGMLGGGQETAGRTALAAQQGQQLGDIRTQAALQAYQQGGNWQQSQNQAIANLLGQQGNLGLGMGYLNLQQQAGQNQAASTAGATATTAGNWLLNNGQHFMDWFSHLVPTNSGSGNSGTGGSGSDGSGSSYSGDSSSSDSGVA